MSILDEITVSKPVPPRITIYGKPGIGKSTLASQFPDPCFLLTEKTGLVNVKQFPVAKKFNEIWNIVVALNKEESLPFKTLVIDSVTQLDDLIIDYILDQEPANKDGKKTATLGSSCGGYGKGYERAKQLHRAFKAICDNLTEKGIGIVYICHLSVSKYKSPESDDYDIFNIAMNHDKSREPYINDVEAVFFCKEKSFVITSDDKRAKVKSTGQKIIVSGVSDGHVSKNRFAMPAEIGMSFDELKKHIPFYQDEKQIEYKHAPITECEKPTKEELPIVNGIESALNEINAIM